MENQIQAYDNRFFIKTCQVLQAYDNRLFPSELYEIEEDVIKHHAKYGKDPIIIGCNIIGQSWNKEILHDAIKSKDIIQIDVGVKLAELIDLINNDLKDSNGTLIKKPDVINRLTLIDAIKNKNRELADSIIDSGICIKDDQYKTVLLEAINNYNRSYDIDKFFIKRLIDLGACYDPLTLGRAVQMNNFEIVKKLLECGAVVNEDALINCTTDNVEIIKLLIEYGLDLSTFSENVSLLQTNDTHCLKLLLKTSTHEQREYALYKKFHRDNIKTTFNVVKLFLSSGNGSVRINRIFQNNNNNHKSSFLYELSRNYEIYVSEQKSFEKEYKKIFEYLMAMGADPLLKNHELMGSVLSYCSGWVKEAFMNAIISKNIMKHFNPIYRYAIKNFSWPVIILIDSFIGKIGIECVYTS